LGELRGAASEHFDHDHDDEHLDYDHDDEQFDHDLNHVDYHHHSDDEGAACKLRPVLPDRVHSAAPPDLDCGDIPYRASR
jgi:hypothetical protein